MTPPTLLKGAAGTRVTAWGRFGVGCHHPISFLGVTGLFPCRGAEQTPVNNHRSHPSAERGGDARGTTAALMGLVLRQPGSGGV